MQSSQGFYSLNNDQLNNSILHIVRVLSTTLLQFSLTKEKSKDKKTLVNPIVDKNTIKREFVYHEPNI